MENKFSLQSGFLPRATVSNHELHHRYTLFQTALTMNVDDIVSILDTLPIQPRDESPEVCQRLYSIMCFIAHRYIFTSTPPKEVLPKQLAVPWRFYAAKCQCPPVLTHAAVDLYNWGIMGEGETRISGLENLLSATNVQATTNMRDIRNLDVFASFTKTRDEACFYLIMTQIEFVGATFVAWCVDWLKTPDTLYRKEFLQKWLVVCRETLTEIIALLRQLWTMCKPDVFNTQFRRFLGGFKSFNGGRGLGYELADGSIVYEPWTGGSAAQSSLIPLIDLFLGVQHESEHARNFLREMRTYMPTPHGNFLRECENKHISHQVGQWVQMHQLFDDHQACLDLLKTFRDHHKAIVHAYVFGATEGTGGTELHTFLHSMIQDTKGASFGEVTSFSLSSTSEQTQERKKMSGETSGDTKEEPEQTVTPWTVESKKGFDYAKLSNQFGMEPITDELIARLKRLTTLPIHMWLRRRIFFCHQDLTAILDAHEKGEKVFLYTGRGPSGYMHLGHSFSFLMTLWFQKAFDWPVVIQLSDEEKAHFDKTKLPWKERCEFLEKFYEDNRREILAFGFDPANTFIFSQFQYGPTMYRVAAAVRSAYNLGQNLHTFGFKNDSTMGQVDWPTQQIAAAFAESFPHFLDQTKKWHCLVPLGADQVVYFRIARDIAGSLGLPKPAMIAGQFLPGLGGISKKMSSTGGENESIFLKDSQDELKAKITKFAFSGGQDTAQKQRELGGNANVDTCLIYMRYFEDDDQALADAIRLFTTPQAELDKTNATNKTNEKTLLSGELKMKLINLLWSFLSNHQARRREVNRDIDIHGVTHFNGQK